MIPEITVSTLEQLLANPTVHLLMAALAVAATVAIGTRYRLGPASDWVEIVRAVALPILDPVIERYIGGAGAAYQLGSEEFVARIDATPEEVERWLWSKGYRRNVLSALKKSPDGRTQQGAWVYRGDEVPETKQLDTMLFSAADGDATDVYGHVEHSSALRWLREDPSVLVAHYQAEEYDPAAGATLLREWLAESEFEWSR